jgi:predicted PurR-regulated permease PerM
MRLFFFYLIIFIAVLSFITFLFKNNNDELLKLSEWFNNIYFYFKFKVNNIINVFSQELQERKSLAQEEFIDKKDKAIESIKKLIKNSVINSFKNFLNKLDEKE